VAFGRRSGESLKKIGECEFLSFQIEDVLEGSDGFLLHLFHGNAPMNKRGQRNDLDAFETTGVDHVIVGEFRGHVERESVKGNAPPESDPHEAQLGLFHPHPTIQRASLSRQSVALQHTDHHLLEAIDEINDPQLEAFKKENRLP